MRPSGVLLPERARPVVLALDALFIVDVEVDDAVAKADVTSRGVPVRPDALVTGSRSVRRSINSEAEKSPSDSCLECFRIGGAEPPGRRAQPLDDDVALNGGAAAPV